MQRCTNEKYDMHYIKNLINKEVFQKIHVVFTRFLWWSPGFNCVVILLIFFRDRGYLLTGCTKDGNAGHSEDMRI